MDSFVELGMAKKSHVPKAMFSLECSFGSELRGLQLLAEYRFGFLFGENRRACVQQDMTSLGAQRAY
jgi:hypothetical protein